MSEFTQNYLLLCLYISILTIFIPFVVLFVMVSLVSVSGESAAGPSESKALEFWWTLGPTLVVSVLCFFNLCCIGITAPDEVSRVIKVVGRQWYWSYELGEDLSYDSMMLGFINSVDKPLRLETQHAYQLIATSSDVIHSFSIPELNIKVDAIPGRVNQYFFLTKTLGTYVGYCSELCGAGHAFMPIVAEVVLNKSG